MNSVRFDRDMTVRWSCRAGEFVIWFAGPSLWASSQNPRIADIWEMRDGDYITITNRICDLPPWFALHPLETSGLAAVQMRAMLEAGYQMPEKALEGPNVWRVTAGSRVAWVGYDVFGRPSREGVVELLEFGENALILGEKSQVNAGAILNFGTLAKNQTADAVRGCQAAVRAVKDLGSPREFTDEWRFGC